MCVNVYCQSFYKQICSFTDISFEWPSPLVFINAWNLGDTHTWYYWQYCHSLVCYIQPDKGSTYVSSLLLPFLLPCPSVKLVPPTQGTHLQRRGKVELYSSFLLLLVTVFLSLKHQQTAAVCTGPRKLQIGLAVLFLRARRIFPWKKFGNRSKILPWSDWLG